MSRLPEEKLEAARKLLARWRRVAERVRDQMQAAGCDDRLIERVIDLSIATDRELHS